MAYLGKVDGPKISDVLRRVGPEHFGFSEKVFADYIVAQEILEKRQRVHGVKKAGDDIFVNVHFQGTGKNYKISLTDKEIMMLGDSFEYELTDSRGFRDGTFLVLLLDPENPEKPKRFWAHGIRIDWNGKTWEAYWWTVPDVDENLAPQAEEQIGIPSPNQIAKAYGLSVEELGKELGDELREDDILTLSPDTLFDIAERLGKHSG